MQSHRLAIVIFCSGLLSLTLSGCMTPPAPPSSRAHLTDTGTNSPNNGTIPAPVAASVVVPKPKPAAKTETYSVVVNNIKVQELLFALARDAKLNVDIHPGIQGTVTLNAIDQTLQQLLTRIAKQVDMRWELDGPNLAVMPDSPFLRIYKVDYVNLNRDATTTVSANSQITSGISGSASGSSGGGSGTTAVGGAAGNVSITKVENKVSHHFWESLERNIKDLLRETDKLLPEGSSETIVERVDQQSTTGTGAYPAASRSTRVTGQPTLAGSPNPAAMQQDETTITRRVTYREAASVIINAETGIVTVRATGRQHEKIQEFLDHVTSSARRQVMIEATIVEVELSDRYQQGIDWSRSRADGSGFALTAPTSANTVNQGAPFSLSYLNMKNPLDINIAVRLLEQFGNVKVLSSPRLSVLNNQSALLKVVENKVYFTVRADVASATVSGAQPTKAVTTTPQSVSVGLVMSVTPQISENNSITLNVRPSITSISAYVDDPSPELRDATGARIPNQIPEIKTREMESIMRVEDGEIAVLGGLMQDRTEYNTGRVPGVGAIPFFGEIFTSRNNLVSKSELVVFLRPVVIRDPSVSGDYAKMRGFLPGEKFFTPPATGLPFGIGATGGTAQP